MLLEIKEIYSSDVDDLAGWRPLKEDASVSIEITIGPKDSIGGDIFQCTIATPKALMMERGSVISNRALIVVNEFDWIVVKEELDKIVSSIKANDWGEACDKLQRFFSWEYEDYIGEA